jgi:acetyltransferase-like isoleucine patch superfamily enzyme
MIAAPSGGHISRFRRATLVVEAVRGLPKTLLFNLRYLPLRQAVRLPVLVSHRVALLRLRGTVTVRDPARFATVLLGFGSVGGFDFKRERSVWQVAGNVIFDGPARLGNGFKLAVGRGAPVTFGANFVLSAESQMVIVAGLTFGRDCLVSWDVLLLDVDGHVVVKDADEGKPMASPIVFGDRVWIGTRATVLKGVELRDDVVVAAGAVVIRPEPESGVLIGGIPAAVLRRGVRWEG